jgi:hypothetical protein
MKNPIWRTSEYQGVQSWTWNEGGDGVLSFMCQKSAGSRSLMAFLYFGFFRVRIECQVWIRRLPRIRVVFNKVPR